MPTFCRHESSISLRLFFLPAAAKCLIKLNERQSLVELRLDEIEFRREVARFAGQNLQVTCAAMLIKHLGKPVGLLRRLGEQVLLLAELAIFLICDERIGNLLERVLNALAVREHCFLPLSSNEPKTCAQCSAREDRLGGAEDRVPGL